MNKGVIIILISIISLSSFIGCNNPSTKDTTSSSSTQEEVDVDKIKEQVKAEIEEENKKKEEQEEQIREQVKKEVNEQNSNSKDVNINVNSNTKPDSVVVVRETIPYSVYYSNSYIFPQSSNSYLSEAQVQCLSNYELGIARNEIFARHGYIFKVEQFRKYFESQSWYIPRYSNQSSISLNSIEEYNVKLIKNEEDRRGIQW